MTEPRKEMLTHADVIRMLTSEKKYTIALAANDSQQRAEIEHLTQEVDAEKRHRHQDNAHLGRVNSMLRTTRNKVLALTEQVRTLREALEDVRANGALASHSHWDRQGTNGVNCAICIAQRELSARVRAALSASPAPAPTSQWQPIETAPKDGIEILLAEDDGSVYLAHWDEGFESKWNSETEELIYRGAWTDDTVVSFGYEETYEIKNPTHWMPLPSAPADREKP